MKSLSIKKTKVLLSLTAIFFLFQNCSLVKIALISNFSKASGPTDSVSYESIFSYRNSRNVRDKIVDLLKEAATGSDVTLSFQTLTSPGLTQSLIKAHERGVRVKVILSYRQSLNTKMRELQNSIGSNLIICGQGTSHKGCLAEKDNINKFILISELSNGDKNVVFITSQNLVSSKNYENAILIKNDGLLYTAYLNYWNLLSEKQLNQESYSVSVNSSNVAYFGTRSSGDTYLAAINNIQCSNNAENNSSLFIAMKYFTRVSIANKLSDKARQGCNVNVVINKHVNFNRNSTLIRNLVRSGVRVWATPDVASSYMLLNGFFGSDPDRQKMVWTGTHNFTNASLTENDNSILRVKDHKTYLSYNDNWYKLKNLSKTKNILKDQIEVLTWNILAQGGQISPYLEWGDRQANVIAKIKEADADVIGLQEVNRNYSQFSKLITDLSDKYNYCEGVVGPWFNTTNLIFVKKGIEHTCTGGYIHYSLGQPSAASSNQTQGRSLPGRVFPVVPVVVPTELHPNNNNCNGVIIEGVDYYNCHFDWRVDNNQRTAIEFVNNFRDTDFVIMGDLNFTTIFNSNSIRRETAAIFGEGVKHYPSVYEDIKRSMDKIGVSKVHNRCLAHKESDEKSMAPAFSNHKLVKATVFKCD